MANYIDDEEGTVDNTAEENSEDGGSCDDPTKCNTPHEKRRRFILKMKKRKPKPGKPGLNPPPPRKSKYVVDNVRNLGSSSNFDSQGEDISHMASKKSKSSYGR